MDTNKVLRSYTVDELDVIKRFDIDVFKQNKTI